MDDESIFSKEGTVARSSQDIVRFFYLQRFEEVLRAEKAYYSTPKESASFRLVTKEWRASLFSLLSLCRPRMLKNNKEPFIPSYILDLIIKGDLSEATIILIDYLESDLKLTDISKVQSYDRTNIILANKMKGYK